MTIRYSFAKDQNGEIETNDPQLRVVFATAMATDEEIFATGEARRTAEEALRRVASKLAFDTKRPFDECLTETFRRLPELGWVSRLRTSPSGAITVHGA